MEKKNLEIDFLTDKDNYYLSMDSRIRYNKCTEIDLSDIALYKIEEVSFEDQSPRREALENVLSAMKIDGINFIYLILGSKEGVEFYYGVSRNEYSSIDPELNIMEIGAKVLEPSIRGNFRGSKIREVAPKDKRDIVKRIDTMTQFSMLEGVPGVTKEDEKFQGVDRLADVMMGDTFGFMIIATPISYDDIKDIEKNLYDIYSAISPLVKQSKQSGTSENESASQSTSKGTSSNVSYNETSTQTESVTVTTGESYSKQTGKSKGTTKGTTTNKTNGYGDGDSDSKGTSKTGSESSNESTTNGTNKSEAKTDGGSKSKGNSKSEGENLSESNQTSKGSSTSSSVTREYIDKKSQDWIKYLDEVIIPRLDYGMGKGIYITTAFLFSDSKATIKKLENTAVSLYSGEKGNRVPLRAISKNNGKVSYIKNFQLPVGQLREEKNISNEVMARSALSQYIRDHKKFPIGNWITTNELALISGLPQKEVVGLALKEEVEFGLNYKTQIKDENRLLLGELIQSGNILQKNNVYLDKADLDKHIFISGVTGSGKTTTCHNILHNSDLPFLVIEPAKTEYRVLMDLYPDLLVFTLGNETSGTPFRLNPFEFFPHESITSRADMIKASIEAAFDMEAAIPQIIESAIYACYEDYGWDISTKKNSKFKNPYDDGVYAFPTLEDLINKVPEIVNEQGFDVRLKNDYIGSIKARLMGLMMGTKGMMLNTPRSIDFKDLVNRRVVLELEEIRNGDEKSLIMGFVLMNLMQAIKAKYMDGMAHRHVTLVEEAHRLLSKFVPGDSPNKKRGVETFTDMLAEIRKYGECLVIVDQIPNKMTPEILKNTNTKIVHKIFAEDDKDAIGNTIVLDKEQKAFLSNLDTGRAVVFSQGYLKAIQVKIKQVDGIHDEKRIKEEELRPVVYEYYAENYKKGLITNSQFLESKPDIEKVQLLLELSYNKKLSRIIKKYCETYKHFPEETTIETMKNIIEDSITESILRDVHERKGGRSEENVQKKEDYVQYIERYKELLEMKLLAQIVIDVFYESKYAKGQNNLQKSILENIEVFSNYLEQYISEEAITLKEKRELSDLL